MNQVLTGALLKGLEATQKVNKGMGKSNMDSITVQVENELMSLTSIFYPHQVQLTIPVDQSQNFSIGIVGVEKMIKAVKKFDTFTSIEIDGNKVIVSDGKKKVLLPTTDNLYSQNELIKDNSFTVDGVRLNEAYSKVKKSISKEIARPILTGVHFKNNYIETVDGFRISQVRISESDFTNNFTIDPKALELILPVAKKDKLGITVSTSENNFTLTTGDNNYTLSIVGNVIEGEFMNTEQLFSSDYEHKLSFSENKEIVLELEFIKDMSINEDTNKPTPARYILNNDKLTIADTSENTSTTVKFDEFTGAKIKDVFKIAFNPNYMLDAIKNISGEFTMQFMSELTPMIIQNEEEKYLVLPMRLN